MMYALKKFFFRSPWHYLCASIVAIAMGLFRFFTLGADVSPRFMWFEILSVSGFVTCLIGALLLVAYWGAFDLFGYVFSPGRTGEHRKFANYADYTQKKEEKRARNGWYFVPYFVVGIVLMLISMLFS